MLLTLHDIGLLEAKAEGLSDNQIAHRLQISSRTVENELYRLRKKLKCNHTSHLIAECFRKNILTMERRKLTTLGELREGDRFVITLSGTVFQVTQPANKDKKVGFNEIAPDGKKKYKYDAYKKANTRVLFLRHTIPLPGEDCFIEDLQSGDVFYKPDDVITEYKVLEKGKDFFKVRRVVDKEGYEMAGRLATVIFVRKKEEVVK